MQFWKAHLSIEDESPMLRLRTCRKKVQNTNKLECILEHLKGVDKIKTSTVIDIKFYKISFAKTIIINKLEQHNGIL